MDINEQLQPIVATILNDLKVSIEGQMQEKVNAVVIEKLASAELNNIVIEVTRKQLEERLAKFNFEISSKQQLDSLVSKVTNDIKSTLLPQVTREIQLEIEKQLAKIDARAIASTVVETKLASLVTSGAFPRKSIPGSSIDFDSVTISGDAVKGGIIEKFGSTGIEDLANSVQMTIMDHAAVFEKAVWTPELQVKGPATVEGHLTVDGDLRLKGDISGDSPAVAKLVYLASQEVKSSINAQLFDGYAAIVSAKILAEGLDLDKIKQGGREVLNGNQLGYHIVDSNLQRVGMLRDLQTQGENLLSDTLYVTPRRVGINTIDPSSTFVVWDEEVEMIMTKRVQNTGYIGTGRNQDLILGANNKDNLRLKADGTVQAEKVTIGKSRISSAPHAPNYSGQRGDILFNENPTFGGPLGWVCLNDTQWANFGIID